MNEKTEQCTTADKYTMEKLLPRFYINKPVILPP